MTFWDEAAQNISTFICKIHMKTKLVSRQNCTPLLLSLAQTFGCPGNMLLTMRYSQSNVPQQEVSERVN
jgi:hypothetical protein